MVQTMLNSSLHTLELQAERKLLAELSRAKDLERSHIKGVYFHGPVTGVQSQGLHIAQSRKTLVPRSSSLAGTLREIYPPTRRMATRCYRPYWGGRKRRRRPRRTLPPPW